jgi:serine/threonine-protein kinase
MRAYCHVHKETFSVAMLTPVVCERGSHSLGNAPNAAGGTNLWGYCCGCKTFSIMSASGTAKTICPVCDREAGKRYLCDQCQTMTVQLATLSNENEVLSLQGVPQSGCPGCDQSPVKAVANHECVSSGATFVSARANCPFCESAIVKQPDNKAQAARAPHNAATTPVANRRSRLRTQVIVGFSVAIVVILLIPGLILIAIFAQRSDTTTNSNRDSSGPPPNMVYVPGGSFMMGTDHGDEYQKPAHQVTVKPFFIDVYEVTCAQYGRFVQETGHQVPFNWSTNNCPNGESNLPATGIDWYDARAYASWANKRLPTEEEWEFAARGTDQREYPWGSEWRSQAANAGQSSAGRLVAVGKYPEGKSPFGALDMVGNAWEWTATDLRPYPGAQISNVPAPMKIIRGGSWVHDPPDWTTTTFRGFARPAGGKDYSKIGFRCVKDAPQPSEKK